MKSKYIIALIERKGPRGNDWKNPNDLRLTQMGVLIDDRPVVEFETEAAAVEAIGDNWSGHEQEFVILKVYVPIEEEKPVRREECDYCDGCGWYEGGPTLKTTCLHCGGSGVKLK